MEKPRQIAVRVLKQHAEATEFLEALLEREFAATPLAPVDRGLVHELTCGVVRWEAALDWLIARKTNGRQQKPALQILLRLGLYQMFWLDRIPDHASVNETVEMAKQLGFGPQAGFLNALLRGYGREHEATEQLLQDLKQTQPALGYSHADWLCHRWQTRWGEGPLRQLLEWNNTAPDTYARLNTLKADAATLAQSWQQEGVRFKPRQFDWAPEGMVFEMESYPPLNSLPSFQQGLFYLQDPSTLLAVQELDPQPGETILDFCAAPGGKTTYLAQRMQNRGRLIAQDTHRARLELVRMNCERLGVTNVERSTVTTVTHPELSLAFDRILVDAPCSNTGVMRRRVDLRWRIRPEEINRLQAVQLELLQDAAAQLKPGGTLVYSTCSLEPEENHSVVKKLLAERNDLRLHTERQLTPFNELVDGAYVARMMRRKSGDERPPESGNPGE